MQFPCCFCFIIRHICWYSSIEFSLTFWFCICSMILFFMVFASFNNWMSFCCGWLKKKSCLIQQIWTNLNLLHSCWTNFWIFVRSWMENVNWDPLWVRGIEGFLYNGFVLIQERLKLMKWICLEESCLVGELLVGSNCSSLDLMKWQYSKETHSDSTVCLFSSSKVLCWNLNEMDLFREELLVVVGERAMEEIELLEEIVWKKFSV